MKRKTTLILCMLIIPLMLLAASSTNVEKLGKDFMIQGGYHDFFSLSVKPLSVESQQYAAGMPFDLQGKDVSSSAIGDGRPIANWSMVTNAKNFTFAINCEDLKYQGTYDGVQPRVSYTLTFSYNVSYFYQGQDNILADKTFYVDSEPDISAKLLAPDEIAIKDVNPVYDKSIDTNSYIGIRDGLIRFKLTPDGDRVVNNKGGVQPPEGYYKGRVVMWLITTDKVN